MVVVFLGLYERRGGGVMEGGGVGRRRRVFLVGGKGVD